MGREPPLAYPDKSGRKFKWEVYSSGAVLVQYPIQRSCRVSATLYQELDDFGMAVDGGEVKRRLAIVCACVDLSFCLYKMLDDL